MDTLRQWQRMYSRELDDQTNQECAATEKIIRKALAGGGEACCCCCLFFLFFYLLIFLLSCFLFFLSLSDTVPSAPAPAKPFDALQDSQLFDAENSEPLTSSGGSCSANHDWHERSRSREVKAGPVSPKRRQSNGSTQRIRTRGTEAAVLYGVLSD